MRIYRKTPLRKLRLLGGPNISARETLSPSWLEQVAIAVADAARQMSTMGDQLFTNDHHGSISELRPYADDGTCGGTRK